MIARDVVLPGWAFVALMALVGFCAVNMGDGDPCAWWDEAGHKLAEVLRMKWDDEAACPRSDRVIVPRAIASDAAYWLEGLAPLVSDDEDRREPLAYARALRAAAGEADKGGAIAGGAPRGTVGRSDPNARRSGESEAGAVVDEDDEPGPTWHTHENGTHHRGPASECPFGSGAVTIAAVPSSEPDSPPGGSTVQTGQIPRLAIRSRVRVDGWGETVYRIWHLGTSHNDGSRDLEVHMGLVEVDEAEPVPPAVSEMDSIEAARADLQDQMGRDELPRAETGLCPEPDDGGHACSLPLRPFYASVADATSAPVLWACATGHILYAARPL